MTASGPVQGTEFETGAPIPQPPTEAETGPPSLAAVGRSALILTGGALVVQLIGIGRELFLAANAGMSSQLDALLIAMGLPTILVGILTSGTTTALVPAYIAAKDERGPREAARLAGAVLTLLGAVALLATALLIVLAQPLVGLVGPGLTDVGREQAVGYLRLLAPTVAVLVAAGLLYAICQAESAFRGMAVATVAGAMTTLVLLVSLWPQVGLWSFAVGTLIGPMVTLLTLTVVMVRRKILPRPGRTLRGLGLMPFARHAAPLTASASILQVGVVFDRAIATLLGAGAVSALRYADVLIRAPLGAIGPAWGSALYPALVRSRQHGDGSQLASATERVLRYVFAAFVPVAALVAAVAPLAVAIAYGRGAFTAEDMATTAVVMAAFAPLVVDQMVTPALAGALNARRSGGVLLAAGTLTVTLNAVLDVAFASLMGVAGIALASSVAATLVATFLARQLSRKEKGFRPRNLGDTLARSIMSAMPGAIMIGWVVWTGTYPSELGGRIAFLAACGVVGLLAYVAIARRLGPPEARELSDAVSSLARRRRLQP